MIVSLACVTKKKRGWRWRARDDACLRSRLLSSVFVSWVLCGVLRFSDSVSTSTPFPDRTRTRTSHKIKSYLIPGPEFQLRFWRSAFDFRVTIGSDSIVRPKPASGCIQQTHDIICTLVRDKFKTPCPTHIGIILRQYQVLLWTELGGSLRRGTTIW